MLAQRTTTRLLCAATLATMFATTQVASAQRKKDETKEQARIEGEAGLKAFGDQKYADAFEHFKKADSLFHAPTLVLYMARCEDKLDKPIEARELYRNLITEAIRPNAPKQFKEAQGDAKRELAEVEKRIAHVRVTVQGDPNAAFTVDGASVPASELAAGKEIDPGTHSIQATGQGKIATKQVTVLPGANDAIALAYPAPVVQAPPREHRKGSLLPAEIAFGVGGAGLVFGAITGIVSTSKTSSVKSDCVGNTCPAADRSKADSAQTFATMSTAGFFVAGIGAAAGVVLLVVRPKIGASASVEVQGKATPNGLELDGRF